MEKLMPPDKKQCQAEQLIGGAFSLGRPHYKRCNKKPTFIITETKKPFGSMSVCNECLVIATKNLGKKSFDISLISTK